MDIATYLSVIKKVPGAVEDLLLDANEPLIVSQIRNDKMISVTKINAHTIPIEGKYGDSNFVSLSDYLNSIQYSIDAVDTIADLRALTVPIDRVWVSGYYDKGDGAFGSKIFKWDSESEEEDNGVNIYKLQNLDIGRYKLAYNGTMTINELGIKSGVQIDTNKSKMVIDYLSKISSTEEVDIVFPAGIMSYNSEKIADVSKSTSMVTIRGADPIQTSFTGVESISGNNGNYSVVYNSSDTSGIEVGDIVLIDNVTPTLDASVNAKTLLDNEMAVGFYRMGEITVTNGSTLCTISNGIASSHLNIGDLVHIQGQTREIVSVGNGNSFSVDSPFIKDVTNFQWWYYSSAGVGSCSTGGVSSSTIDFQNGITPASVDVGDIIIVNGEMRKIKTIVDTNTITVNHNITIDSGTKYTIFTMGYLHHGAYEVTNVTTTSFTVKNKSRFMKPPVKKITYGDVTVIKTIFKNTLGNGLDFLNGGEITLENIAIVGSNLTGTTGLSLNGIGDSYNIKKGGVILKNSAVMNFDSGIVLSSGCTLRTEKSYVSGNNGNGIVSGDGALAYLRDAVISGNGGIGILSSGGHSRLSGAIISGNGLQGIRLEVGASAYGDQPKVIGNSADGIIMVNRCGIQFTDGISILNGGNGADFQNGAGGRVSRTLFGCNALHNITVTNSDIEATQAWITGSAQSGIVCQRGKVDIYNGASTGNNGNGMYCTTGGDIFGEDAYISKNSSYGVRVSSSGSHALIDSSLVIENDSGNISISDGGTISTDELSSGNTSTSSSYREIVNILDQNFHKIYVGDNTAALTLFSSSTNSIYGQVRCRCGSSESSALMYGASITASTGVHDGTTGNNGELTVAASNDGYIYIENRTGSDKIFILDMIGRIV